MRMKWSERFKIKRGAVQLWKWSRFLVPFGKTWISQKLLPNQFMQMPILCEHYEIPALTSYLVSAIKKVQMENCEYNCTKFNSFELIGMRILSVFLFISCLLCMCPCVCVCQSSQFQNACFRGILWTISNSFYMFHITER